MADQEEQTGNSSFPSGRIKRIMKLDKDINKINSDALFLISNATELFVKFLAEKSSEVAIEKKRKTIKLEHLRIAVKRHQPTADFLLDSLPVPPPAPVVTKSDRVRKDSDESGKAVPACTRRIDSFFKKVVPAPIELKIDRVRKNRDESDKAVPAGTPRVDSFFRKA